LGSAPTVINTIGGKCDACEAAANEVQARRPNPIMLQIDHTGQFSMAFSNGQRADNLTANLCINRASCSHLHKVSYLVQCSNELEPLSKHDAQEQIQILTLFPCSGLAKDHR